MGRLIREDDVMRMLTGVELNNGTITDAKIELRNVKTAYDVDKVVEQLEELKEKSLSSYDYETMKIVTDIVKRGGVE